MGELIPIFGMATGTIMTVILIFGVVKVMQGPVGQALARRIHGRGGAEDLSGEVAQLREDLHAVRGELAEVQERLDFTERLLARGAEARQLSD